jgi:hypothetical protein
MAVEIEVNDIIHANVDNTKETLIASLDQARQINGKDMNRKESKEERP